MLRERFCSYRVLGSGIFPERILSSFIKHVVNDWGPTLGRSVGPMSRLFVNRKTTIAYIFVFGSAFIWVIDSIFTIMIVLT